MLTFCGKSKNVSLWLSWNCFAQNLSVCCRVCWKRVQNTLQFRWTMMTFIEFNRDFYQISNTETAKRKNHRQHTNTQRKYIYIYVYSEWYLVCAYRAPEKSKQTENIIFRRFCYDYDSVRTSNNNGFANGGCQLSDIARDIRVIFISPKSHVSTVAECGAACVGEKIVTKIWKLYIYVFHAMRAAVMDVSLTPLWQMCAQ